MRAFALAVAAAALAGLAGPTVAQDALQITSDTQGYCVALAQRLESRSDLPVEARALTGEGRRMCETGHVRGGLVRLRRAMMILRGQGD